MKQTQPVILFRPGFRRLSQRQLIRLIRIWESRPVRQRKREVLAVFTGLLLLGSWSVSSNVSSQPPELLPNSFRVSAQKSSIANQPVTQRKPHERNRSDSARRSGQ